MTTTHVYEAYFLSSISTCTVSLANKSIISSWLIDSGKILGMEATQVLSRSSFGFLSPLQQGRGERQERGRRGDWRGRGGEDKEEGRYNKRRNLNIWICMYTYVC